MTARARRGSAAAALALLAACSGLRHHETTASAQQKVMDRRRQGLQTLLTAAEQGKLLPFDSVLLALDQSLVQDLMSASLPLERVISGRFRVRIERASVQLDDGFALVRLDGVARLVDQPDQASAEVSLFGGLDVVELDPATGLLRAGMHVIAFDARVVKVVGVKSSVAERLVEDLGREQLDAFEPLAGRIEVPVQVQSEVTLPAVGPEGGVRIAAAAVPMKAVVADVRSFRGKLWVSLSVKAGAAPPAAAP